MITKEFRDAIKIIHEKLEKNNIKWALIGSTNMAVQGINVTPRDMDIVVQLKDLSRIQEIFSGYRASAMRKLKPMTQEPGWEVRALIKKVFIQFLGERDTGEYVSKLLANELIEVKIDRIKVPCFTLDAEAKCYSETNREPKARLIRMFLKG